MYIETRYGGHKRMKERERERDIERERVCVCTNNNIGKRERGGTGDSRVTTGAAA